SGRSQSVRSDGKRNRDVEFRALRGITGEVQAAAHGLRAVANPNQAKVSVRFAIQATRVKATTVVAYAKSQLIGGVFQNDFHLRRTGVNCGVGDPLFANAQ